MRELSAGLAAHLASGVTTLCWCWRVTRRDGTAQGFTDHDRDVVFDATTFEAAAGFTQSDIKQGVGLSVDNLDVSGALSSDALREDDLASGRYDDARVEIFRVNWANPDERVLLRAGSLGEVKRAGSAFTAEVRGLSHYLQQPRGRLFQYTCDADLGDARCGVDLESAVFRGLGTIAVVETGRRFRADGLGAFASGWFARGLLTFTSGAAAGQAIEVKRHVATLGVVTFDLWAEVQGPLVAGQSFVVTAGCDKLIGTCRAKFSNAVNFRGFPSMPGNDFVARGARR